MSAPAWPLNEADVGPTHDRSRTGIPTTDGAVDFEDLMVVAMNFNLVTPMRLAPVAATAPRLTWTELEAGTWALALEAACPSLKGLRLRANLPEGALTTVTPGEALAAQTAPVFLRNIEQHGLDVSLALLGTDAGIAGAGELLRVVLPDGVAPDDIRLEARGIDNADLGADVETISAPDAPPLVFALHQNLPNPFNPATTIRFALPEPQPVRLSIYGVDGRRVATLIDQVTAAGQHEVVWRGTDDRGQKVASGTYIYRIEAGPYSQTRKMALLK
jgi:hypothetical protein